MIKNILIYLIIPLSFIHAENNVHTPKVNLKNTEQDLIVKGYFASYEIDTSVISIEIAHDTISNCEKTIWDICTFFDLDEQQFVNKFRYYLYGPNNGHASWEGGGEVTIYDVETRQSAYYHETVHAVLGYSPTLWLREGIAEYFDFENSKHEIFDKKNRTLDQIAKEYLLRNNEYRKSLQLIFNGKEDIKNPTRIIFQSYYIYTASFVGYLLSLISPEDFMRLYHSLDVEKELKEITGYDLYRLKIKWMKHIGVNGIQLIVNKLL